MASDVSEKDMKLDLQPTSIKFNGYSQSKKVTYAVELDFYAEIDPKESKIHHSDRAVEMVLRKKELKEEFWPRLLKESKRLHFLKTDFDKVSRNRAPCHRTVKWLTGDLSGLTRTSKTRQVTMRI